MQITAVGPCQAERSALDALLLPEATVRRIGDRAVTENDLAGCECTRITRIDLRTHAKQGDLKTECLAPLAGVDPTGDVPPFDAIVRMAAMIARKLQRLSRLHGGEWHGIVQVRGR